jgi:hydrogen cyanide synthase HcnC
MLSSDALIVGGGLVGAAVAYGFARAGLQVAILDEGDVAFRAARGNAGLVWLQGKGDGAPAYADWTRKSVDLWPDFAAQLLEDSGIDVAYRRPGGIVLCLGERELEAQREQATRMRQQTPSYDCSILDRHDLSELVPEVGPEVTGAAYSPSDGDANSLHLFRALHEAINRMGGRYLPNRQVLSIRSKGAAFLAATTRETFGSALLVIAAGLGSRRLGAMLGESVPVRPQRGQIIVTERLKPFLNHIIPSARQTVDGTVIIGDSEEEVGLNDAVELSVVSILASRTARMIPMLGRVKVVRSWAALRIMSPDGLPIYQQIGGHPGAFVATCHSGVTLAAAHVLKLAPAILDRTIEQDYSTFSARRFLDSPTAQ